MAASKVSLKTINAAIRQQNWDEALAQADTLLAKDSKNYQAHVFKGYVLDRLDQVEDAVKSYTAATEVRPDDVQAWQGLVKIYERSSPGCLDDYRRAAIALSRFFGANGEMYKCQDVIDKFVDFARKHGTRLQYAAALHVMLPDSPVYADLEGRLPHAAKTYETIAQILEVEEKQRVNTLIGERRTRLGAKLSEVTLAVNREVMSQSELPSIYEQLILWTNDDDTRRKYEEKLLQFRYDLLVAMPASKKRDEHKIVQKLANDMVIINHPFKLAWDIAIEWQDCQEIRDLDVNVLNAYRSHFPGSPLCKVLTGFLTSDLSPFPKKPDNAPEQATQSDESEDDEDGGAPTSIIPYTEEERIVMMAEGISATTSLLAYRLMGEYYQHLEDYESNSELMRKALKMKAAEAEKTGKSFDCTEKAYMIYLGTALVFYQSPRNHGEAKTLFDAVLKVDPSSTAAMIGVGLIYEEEEEYDQAIDFLNRALEGDSTNLRVRAEVGWLYALKGDYARGRTELEGLLPAMTSRPVSKELLAQTQYRLGCCIWNADPSKEARRSRSGAYAYFMRALQNNVNYAPAFSILGVYYADYAKKPDRARGCFIKAIELSTSEVESAERLARSFANDGDWDRVELVARRVMNSGRVKPPPGSKKKGISWPLSALGVAELNKQEYAKAIVSFQQALRISPNDYHSWVGLGESYHNFGRHIAATKAIENAQRLEAQMSPQDLGDAWFTKYILANVKRQLGEFDEAVDLYQDVISTRPHEEGVVMALMQTMVENALDCIGKGLFGKAIDLATRTLSFAASVSLAMSHMFNFWKSVGDACSIFSKIRGDAHKFPIEAIREIFEMVVHRGTANAVLHDIDGIGKELTGREGSLPEDEQFGADLTRVLHATILAHKNAVHLAAQDVHAHAVAYYNLGWAEYRAHSCLPPSARRKTSKYQKAAVRCFKRSIELESGNADFWNALGVATSEINPSVAQHAFVRALYLNERSPYAWTNLGALALLQNDLQLANEAFTRAQSTDPDYAQAWAGQGFVALLYGVTREAQGLFAHAADISDAATLVAKGQYPMSVFDTIMAAPSKANVATLMQPLFALTQLKRLKPQDLAHQHLLTLFQERTGDNANVIATLGPIREKLEANYEATESADSLARFALGTADLARSYLACGRNKDAIECGELALELSSDDSAQELTAEQRRKARLSAHLTTGLAQYFDGQPDAGISYLEAALEESDNDPNAACLLAQVLWAIGTEDARERARSVLFDVIGREPNHVQAVLLLGVIALLDADAESLDAVVSELHTLRTSEKITDIERLQIGEVLRTIAELNETSTEEDALAQIQNDVMLYPHLPHGWSRLGEFSGAKYPSDMALNVALKSIPPKGELGAEDLADAYAGTGVVSDAQAAIMIAPWTRGGWESLGSAVAG